MEPNGGAGKSWQYKQQVRFAGRISQNIFFEDRLVHLVQVINLTYHKSP